MKTNPLVYILALLMLASCGTLDDSANEQIDQNLSNIQKKDENQGSQTGQTNQAGQSNSGLNLGNQESKALSYVPLTTLQQAVAGKEMDFSFNLLKAVSKSDVNNLAVSTFGMFTNLSMLSVGVTGDTYREIVSAMDLGGFAKEEVAAYCSTITNDLKTLDNNVAFESSNSFWYDLENARPVSSYVSLIGTSYGAEAYKLDNKSLYPSEPVNSWASRKSHGLIPEIVEKEKQYKWLLANVTFFEGAWTSDKYVKEQLSFTDIAGTKSEKEFFGPQSLQEMKGFNMDFAAAGLPSVIWIPYGNEAFSMAVILPPEGVSLSEFIAGFAADSFATYSANAKKEDKVMFRIPAFDNTCTIKKKAAVDAFKALGINRAFEQRGEFGGMLENPDVCLDEVIMSSKITVNEKGTKTVGASVIGQGFGADLPKTYSFTADRPFVYAIVDIHNTVLFIGTVTK